MIAKPVSYRGFRLGSPARNGFGKKPLVSELKNYDGNESVITSVEYAFIACFIVPGSVFALVCIGDLFAGGMYLSGNYLQHMPSLLQNINGR
jgi:hypothetical protein